MLKSYIKVAFRNLSRNKAFSFINIFGLSIGLTTCILIMLYIFSELGYDSQNKDADRIYRIAYASDKVGSTKEKPWAATSAPMAWGLESDLPDVEQATRLLKFPGLEKMLLKYENDKTSKKFYETNGYYVDSNFFQIFTYDFKYGNALTVLDKPNTIVISEDVALKMFGNENPINKTIIIGIPYGSFNYTVTGVFKNKMIKSHIPAHFFISMRNGDIGTWVEQQQNWATNNIFYTYIKLKQHVDPKAFEQRLKPFIERRAGPDLKALGVSRLLLMQPLQDIYLRSNIDSEISTNGNITYLYILGSISLFVLLIACINFMNLSTARSSKRAKEVGVRKVMGAVKRYLVFQFLAESVILCFLSLLLAVVLSWFLLPIFNQLTQKELQLFGQGEIWLWITGLTVFTGFISGVYPAFYLSAFQPITVLKGKLLNNFSAVAIRKGLVIFQFTISICLVLGAIIISRQLNYLNAQDLGFNKAQQVILPMQSQSSIKNYDALKKELLKTSGIKRVTSGSTYPGIENINDMLYYPEGKTVKDVVDILLANVDYDYIETLGLTLLEGHGFSKDFVSDSSSLVVNEAALRELGFNLKSAIGRKLYYDFQGKHTMVQIVGVVKDFNFESLYNPIKAFAFNTVLGNKHAFVIANLNTADYAGIIKNIEHSWNKVNPDQPFVYSFLDKDFQMNYEKDKRTSSIVGYFTAIAILIACMGLFGLAAFFAEVRTKEIGIRKALGATVGSVTLLLTKDFMKLVLIAILIASPLGFTIMNKWLENFSYRVSVSWWMFALAGFFSVIIALLTVGYQSIKAALANPVKSLKME
jgi:putative ABC transport system permease protein